MSLCLNPNCLQPKNTDTALFCQSCGSELLLDGRYRVIGELGGGGFGKTYEALDCNSSNLDDVANNIKVLKVLTLNHPKYVELFQREAQFLSRFHHPGIPSVEPDAYFIYYPHQVIEPLHCLVMEKIEGLDLKQYIRKRKACISQKRAIKWLIQVTVILKEMHRQNFFHRDIKPSNIMLRANGQLALIDFGTAREVTETYLSKRPSGQVTGLFSAGYSPIEQLNGRAVPQSDFFALGRTFVFLLTGKPPSDFYDSYIDELRWKESALDILDSEFVDFLDYMMARLPGQRPKDADEIIQTLKALYQQLYIGGEDTRSQGTQTRQNNNIPSSPSSLSHKASDTNNHSEITTPMKIPASSSILPPLPDIKSSSPPTTAKSGNSSPSLDPEFVKRCQTLLAELVGPVASIVCQKTLNKNPNQSEQEFVAALAQKIPNPEQAKRFQSQIFP